MLILVLRESISILKIVFQSLSNILMRLLNKHDHVQGQTKNQRKEMTLTLN